MSTIDSKKIDLNISERKVDFNRQKRQFIKGPLPLDWFIKASLLPGKAAIIGLVLWFRSGLEQKRTITLSNATLARFGVDRHAKYRGLQALKKAGLVSIEPKQGKNPTVTILDVEQPR
jgi:hypothetical protein